MFAKFTKWPRIKPETIQKVQGFLEAGNTSLDLNLLETFEADLGRYFNVPHALLTNNGTSASLSAFHALGLQPGDEIIAPCYTHWATVIPATLIGCRVVFADVEEDSLSISVESVRSKISPQTRAIVVCHLYGNPADMLSLRQLCDERGIYLVEDISHAPGATIGGKKVGSFGDIAFLSFQASKIISAGEGGALLARQFTQYARAVQLGHPKRIFRLPASYQAYNRVGLGYKFRLPAISALLAYESFKDLENTISIRREMFDQFWSTVQEIPGLEVPRLTPGGERVYFRWELFLPGDARDIVHALKERGIEAEEANYEFLPGLPHFAGKTDPGEKYPNARRLLKRLILLNPFTACDSAGIRLFAAQFQQVLKEGKVHG